MNSTQYTIRSIPPKVDWVLRQRAQKAGKSLNEIVVDALSKATGIASETSFNDLDWFIGNKSLDQTFDDAIEWLDSAPKDIQ